MSLPPGFLDELRARVSLTQVVGRKVTWDTRKSNQGKGDMWAPCPFHQEKTASFHVDDQKGFYYCFGCHAKGNAFTFVQETENVGFMEAVEILAREVGLPMPARDPQAQKKADRRTQLAEVMEQAVQYFALQLKTGAAAEARAYLDRRGLDAAALQRFEIGFAPAARQGVFQHLTGKGVAPDLVIDAGLAAKPDDGGAPYDRFRGRIIFPIRDARGRAMALGGRAMDPNARAKYLNSPETELFDKGRSLYNHAPAREAAGKGAPLIVAEGYMDVIALVEGGYPASVAPLGTAITEHQLELLWRITPEPIIALDGDTAGLRAAMRVVDLALPLLEAGKSLRFALMPEKQDPDDVIRSQGPGAIQTLLDQAVPMVQLLWRRETEGKVFDSPERRAALDKVLRDKIRVIQDPSLRSHYGQELKNLRFELFSPPRRRINRGGGSGGWKAQPDAPRSSTRQSLLAQADAQDVICEAVVLATVIRNPQILTEFEPALEDMECLDDTHAVLRSAILRQEPDENLEDRLRKLHADPLDRLLRASHIAITPAVRRPGDYDLARATVADALAKLEARRGVAREIAEATRDLDLRTADTVTWRLGQASKALDQAQRSQQEDTTDYERAQNGTLMNRDERTRLDDLLSTIRFGKKNGDS